MTICAKSMQISLSLLIVDDDHGKTMENDHEMMKK